MFDLSSASLEQLLHIQSLLYEHISPNEELDEVKTADLPYICVNFFIARLYSNLQQDRASSLEQAKRHYELFFDWLTRFELGRAPIEPSDPLLMRQQKIQRFSEVKELQGRITNVPTKDEEALRDYWTDWIKHKYLQSIDEYYMVVSELKLLKLRGTGQVNTSASKPAPRTVSVTQPFILTREKMKEAVFRPSHNLPTMTIDQFLELEQQRGNIINGTGETIKKDPETDKDFDEETVKLRDRDERWDWITKGSGNSYNRA